MENGFRIFWTDHALAELAAAYEYLETCFTEQELKRLTSGIEQALKLITKNPKLFPLSDIAGVRKVVIKKFNTLYYRETSGKIEIISFFSNRQNPEKRKKV